MKGGLRIQIWHMHSVRQRRSSRSTGYYCRCPSRRRRRRWYRRPLWSDFFGFRVASSITIRPIRTSIHVASGGRGVCWQSYFGFGRGGAGGGGGRRRRARSARGWCLCNQTGESPISQWCTRSNQLSVTPAEGWRRRQRKTTERRLTAHRRRAVPGPERKSHDQRARFAATANNRGSCTLDWEGAASGGASTAAELEADDAAGASGAEATEVLRVF
jgi:hypothetical protein